MDEERTEQEKVASLSRLLTMSNGLTQSQAMECPVVEAPLTDDQLLETTLCARSQPTQGADVIPIRVHQTTFQDALNDLFSSNDKKPVKTFLLAWKDEQDEVWKYSARWLDIEPLLANIEIIKWRLISKI